MKVGRKHCLVVGVHMANVYKKPNAYKLDRRVAIMLLPKSRKTDHVIYMLRPKILFFVQQSEHICCIQVGKCVKSVW